MDTIGDRILYLRKDLLGLKQEEFGKRIKVKRTLVSNLEKNIRQLTDRTSSDICREFNVNEEWLRTGEGDIFKPENNDIDYLIAKYGDELDETQKAILIAMLKMPKEQRDAVSKFIDELIALREKQD